MSENGDGGGSVGRRGFLYTAGATIGGTSVLATTQTASSIGNPSSRLELVGHTTLGARDGANTYAAVSEEHDLAAVGTYERADNELRLVDISDRTDPVLVSTIDTDPEDRSDTLHHTDIHPTEPWIFTANEGGADAGWAIVDASDREDPELIGPFTVEDAPEGVHNVKTLGVDHLLSVGHGRGLVAYDIGDLEEPVEVSSFQMPEPGEGTEGFARSSHLGSEGGGEYIHAVYVRDEYAFIAHWDRGMFILDMSDPEAPEEVASFDYTEEETDVELRCCHHTVPHPERDICLLGDESDSDKPGYKHIVEFDLESGETELLTSSQFPQQDILSGESEELDRKASGHFSDWGVGDQRDVLFSGDYHAGVQVFDVSDPDDIVPTDQHLTTEGVDEIRQRGPDRHSSMDHVPLTWNVECSMAGDSGFVYASDTTTGLYVLTLEETTDTRSRSTL